MKKIIIVNNNLQIGGVQKSLVNLLNEIKNEYSITLLLFRKSGGYLKDVPENVKILEANTLLQVLGMSLDECRKRGFGFIAAKAVFVAISRLFGNATAIKLAMLGEIPVGEFDIAISYLQPAPRKQFYGGTNEYVLAKTSAAEKISFIHSDFENYGGDINYSKRLFKRFNKIVFCSFGCKETFLNAMPEFSNRSYVVYNCHNIKNIKSQSELKPLKYKNNEFNVALVARLTYEKGIDSAIKAVNRYAKNISERIHLHIVGDGADADDFKSLTSSLGATAYVSFYGNQNNPYRIMKNADLLLLTSHHEAAPMVFGEANILGLNILTTKTTSTLELVVKPNIGDVCEDNLVSIFNSLKELASRSKNRVRNQPIKANNINLVALEQLRVVLGRTKQ